MKKTYHISVLLTIVFALSAFSLCKGQYRAVSDIITDTIDFCDNLFSEDEPIEFIIKFNLKNFQKTRAKEEYQNAILTWVINDSLKKEYNVRLKTRGIFRKKFCNLPPFWLNIKHSGIEFPAGEGFSKMKVVTHCNKNKKYNDYILKEYLTYKMYNHISPISFQVRLVKITYIDTGRENKTQSRWAFLIEPNKLLERRLDGILLKSDEYSMKQMNAREMDRLAHFQYMIGNGDYSITGMHNIKIIQLSNNKPSGRIPIPYDFDYTGIVNASYATPGEHLGIENIRERYFLGPCRSDSMHQLVIDYFVQNKHDLEELIESFEYLSLDHKIEMLKYIESYYTSVSRDSFIERNISSTCR